MNNSLTRVNKLFFIPVFISLTGLMFSVTRVHAEERTVSIFIIRHAEADKTQPTTPLTSIGQQRAEILASTLKAVAFTHLFASHTTRTRQTLEPIAAIHSQQIVQLPKPGSILDGQPVTDDTSRRVPIEPISEALLKLPAGSIALAALNSENIFAIMNRLGVPVAEQGKTCVAGSMCVPCLENKCYPPEYDRLWHVVLLPGSASPLSFTELRYGAGWIPKDR